ncbi:hypothetical protein FOCC_FOCC013733 [Frankliniella occidentalis]|nr:hypothetical protein FOCC_FOCC013733 [Frankliniella occidentalis]
MICCSSFTDQPVVYKCAMHMMTEPDFLWNMVSSQKCLSSSQAKTLSSLELQLFS